MFVDLHSHVLWGLDDGARDLGESVEMLKRLRDVGFGAVYATPHQKVGSWVPSRAAIDAAHVEVTASAQAAGVALEFGLGAENMWDELFFRRSQDGTIPGYSGGRAFLVELPPETIPVGLEDGLFRLRVRGLLPVLAHPERYSALCADDARVERLARQAALLVDLGALDGNHGFREARRARRLVEERLAAACATDVHGPDDVRAAAAGIAWIRKRLGEVAVERLLCHNPRSLLSGELPEG